MSDQVGDLCTQCGLCCSGLLYGWGELLDEEVSEARKNGFDVQSKPTGEPAFRLRCTHFCGTTCSVYEVWRPETCHTYLCALAKQLKSGEIRFEDATAKVGRMHELAGSMFADMTPGETRADLAECGVEDRALAVRLAALQIFVDRHFRLPGDPPFLPRR